MQLNEAIKLRLSNLMKKYDISKYELSCRAGLNPSILNDFYRNKISYPRIDTLYLLCEALGITLTDFFNNTVFDIENVEIKDSEN